MSFQIEGWDLVALGMVCLAGFAICKRSYFSMFGKHGESELDIRASPERPEP